ADARRSYTEIAQIHGRLGGRRQHASRSGDRRAVRGIWRAAGARLGAIPELGVVARGTRLHAHDARRDRQHDLILLDVGVIQAEELAEDWDVTQAGDFGGVARVGVGYQAGEDLGLAVLQAQQRARIARADLIRDRPR